MSSLSVRIGIRRPIPCRPREVIAIQNQKMAAGFLVVVSWLLAYVSAARKPFSPSLL